MHYYFTGYFLKRKLIQHDTERKLKTNHVENKIEITILQFNPVNASMGFSFFSPPSYFLPIFLVVTVFRIPFY